MSVKAKLMYEISKAPRSKKYLKEKFAGVNNWEEKVSDLMKDGKVIKKDGKFYRADSKRIKRGEKPESRDFGKKVSVDAVPCKLVKLTASFGFASPMDNGADIFILGKYLKGAMVGDLLRVEITSDGTRSKKTEGRVVAIDKENNRIIGTVQKLNGRLFVEPDNGKGNLIKLELEKNSTLKEGDKVAAEIFKRGESHFASVARVVIIFGDDSSAKSCAQSILFGANITSEFGAKAIAQAEKYQDADIDPDDIKGRLDIRDQIIFTIDGANTKDIDDAISLTKTDGGYKLGVHIADVSHYVKENSPLDHEAFNRGTSVYYADSVVPMLPTQLSNGICSLNPQVDRLAFSCFVNLDGHGNVVDYKFEKTVIHSKLKGVYDEINLIFGNEATGEISEKYKDVLATLEDMKELFLKLEKKRNDRGSMNIESGEAKICVDENGKCVNIVKRQGGTAEKMIEEFMLLANQCGANLARTMEFPFVYRIHELPDPQRVETLKANLHDFGLFPEFQKDIPSQIELSKLLDDSRDTPMERSVHINILRTMAKAVYSPIPKGHYGLSLEDYAHFTSPIRRYPDLAIHRILSDYASGVGSKDLYKKYKTFAKRASDQSSYREVAAMQSERSCNDCYKAEYMRQFIGEDFTGLVSGLTGHGIYIELDNTVEGLVCNDNITRGEIEFEQGMYVKAVREGITYRMGDSVTVRVISVNVAQGEIDFGIVKNS